MNIFTEILNYLDVAAPLIAIFFFIPKLKKISKELFLVFIFLLLQLLCNASASILEQYRLSNYFVYAINLIASFFLLNYLFYLLFINVKAKFIISTSIIIFNIFLFSSLIKGEGIHTYNSTISALASFIIAGFCLYFFYIKFVFNLTHESAISHAIFWAVTGIFTYYTGSFFIFISYKYLIEINSASIGTLWQFHNVLLLVCCIYISYGITCKSYQKI